MVFPFIAAFIDMCCGETDSCPLTKVCSQYTELMTFGLKLGSTSGWTELELRKLQRNIHHFKTIAREVFGEYHTSDMGTRKSHLLDHLVSDIRRVGGLQHIEAGPYEHSHVHFKNAYRQTSQRRSTGLEETYSKFNMEECVMRAKKMLKEATGTEETKKDDEDSPDYRLPDKGFEFSFLELTDAFTSARTLFRSGTEHADAKDLCSLQGILRDEMIQFLLQVGFQGGTAFITLLEEVLGDITSGNYKKRASCRKTVTLSCLKSLFFKGGFLPTIEDYDEEANSIIFRENYEPVNQRAVADVCFGSGKRPRFSFVLLRAEKGQVWVSKVVAFIRINVDSNRQCSGETEFALVRYMQVVRPENNIQKELGCVVLRWATDEDNDARARANFELHITHGINENLDEAAPWYGFHPISSILRDCSSSSK